MDYRQASAMIKPLDREAMTAARERQDKLVKPAGSLGALEDISVQIAGITGSVKNRTDRKVHFLLAADNGVYGEGIAAAPQEFTNLLMSFYARGVSCGINVLCKRHDVELRLVDMGVKGELPYENIKRIKLMPDGTGNMLTEPAMPREIAEQAVGIGIGLARQAHEDGYRIIGTGEVGMGNTTTAAACIKAALGEYERDAGVGRGAGLSDEAFEHKKDVIARALELHKPDKDDAIDILSKVGGLDIAGLCGIFLGGAAYRVPVVIDGVISIAAGLLACVINPLAKDFMIPSHISEEPAYKLACESMGLDPLMSLGMRLGEGAGCPIAMGVIEDALAIINDMSTFEETALDDAYREGITN